MEELIELSQLAVGLAILVFFLVVVVRPVIRPQLATQIYRAQLEAKGLKPAIAAPPSLAGERAKALAEGIAAVKAEGRAKGGAYASDAFFPFPDSIELIKQAGIAAIIQPGGSKRDAEVIAAADAAGIPMVFTARRHFRH